MPTKTTKAERTYRRVLAEQERSGLSIRAFAAERGHSAGHLSWWRHEIRKRDAARASASAQAVRAKPAKKTNPAATPAFLPVRVIGAEAPMPVTDSAVTAAATAEGGYEVVVASGRRVLRLPRDFDVTRVAALVRAVEAAC